MSLAAELIAPASNVVSVALLLGIFHRLGGMRASMTDMQSRLRRLEVWRARAGGWPIPAPKI